MQKNANERGFKNPNTVQMKCVLGPEIKVCFLVNLDDLLLYKWETWDKQLVDVEVVLERLRDNLIYTRESKCDFWVEMVYFSGFKASQATLMTE